MRILALDSSTSWGSTALLEGPPDAERSELVAELGLRVRASHAPALIESIELLLRLAGWSRTSIDGYVATRGPGSFTGIRVALGTVRGLGLANDRPCAGVSALDALAEAHGPSALQRLALIAAGRGELFGQCFDAASSPVVALEEPWLDRYERVVRANSRSKVLAIPACGTATLLHAAGLGDAGVQIAVAPRSLAAAAGRLALARGAFTEPGPDPLSPLYLRPPDAELPKTSGGA